MNPLGNVLTQVFSLMTLLMSGIHVQKMEELMLRNPCSEYMFLDDTACNLASLNLVKFTDDVTGMFDVDKFIHACEIWTMVLEISVLMAQFPSKEIAKRSFDYRTLGLGYANIGAMLMRMGHCL
jgi:ribonucleoside-diphosphate reductase alpha chain